MKPKALFRHLGTVLLVALILVGVTMPGPVKVSMDQKIQAQLLRLERQINSMIFGPRQTKFQKRDYFFGRFPPSKLGHTAAFFVLTLAVLRKCTTKRHRWYCLASLCLFAALTEWLQFFAIARTPTWQDFWRDLIGIALSAAVVELKRWRTPHPDT